MPRRPAIILLVCAGLSVGLAPGCQPSTPSEAKPAANGIDYGANKMPPAEQVAPKKGRAARAPGAPPASR